MGAFEIQAASPCPPCPTRTKRDDDDGGGRDFINDKNYAPAPPFVPFLGSPMPGAAVVEDVPTLLGTESKTRS
jgi:hypothetical protein